MTKASKKNSNKKLTYQSVYIRMTDELESDMFTYGPTTGKDCVDSKEGFHDYASVKYRMDIKNSLKKGKQGTYNNPRPKYIHEDTTRKVSVSGTDVEESHHNAETCKRKHGKTVRNVMGIM